MDDLDIRIAERDIYTPRRLKVSPAEAYAAFADPTRLARWWGPKGFRNTMQVFELRPGGRWHVILHNPDGRDHPNQSVFLEVVDGRRIVYDHGDHAFIARLEFLPDGEGCLASLTMRFPTAAEREAVAEICIPSNEENFDRLEAELERVTVAG